MYESPSKGAFFCNNGTSLSLGTDKRAGLSLSVMKDRPDSQMVAEMRALHVAYVIVYNKWFTWRIAVEG
jgi:hypothetical protein